MLCKSVMEIDVFAVTYTEPTSRYIIIATNSEIDVIWNNFF